MTRRSRTERIIHALTRLVEKIKCRLICCYSSCNDPNNISGNNNND